MLFLRASPVALLLFASGCPDFGTKVNRDFCGFNGGDSHCAERHGDARPFCIVDTEECVDQTGITFEDLRPTGCSPIEPPLECRFQCGIWDEENECLTDSTDESSSGEPSTGGTETDPTTGTGTDDTSTTTGPTGCQGPDDCTDPAQPFCVDEVCVACSATAEPDTACASLDIGLPLCVGTECVQCSAENADACDSITPLCDATANTCVGCSFHEECQAIGAPACNIATGACFDPANVTEVNAGTADSIQAAIDAVADGGEHAVLITGGGQLHTITIDSGKTIALVSANNTTQSVRGNDGDPVITVTGATAYFHRLRVEDTDDVGIAVASGATLYADSVQVVQNSSGDIQLDSGTTGFLRNTMVGADVNSDAVVASGAELDVLYSTLVGNFGASSLALSCSGGAVTVRNSITVSRADDAVNCGGASVATTFEAAGGSYDEGWFDLDGGDLSLNSAADFDGVAIWEDGDPPFDFEGNSRPTTDGSTDYAGADVP